MSQGPASYGWSAGVASGWVLVCGEGEVGVLHEGRVVHAAARCALAPHALPDVSVNGVGTKREHNFNASAVTHEDEVFG